MNISSPSSESKSRPTKDISMKEASWFLAWLTLRPGRWSRCSSETSADFNLKTFGVPTEIRVGRHIIFLGSNTGTVETNSWTHNVIIFKIFVIRSKIRWIWFYCFPNRSRDGIYNLHSSVTTPSMTMHRITHYRDIHTPLQRGARERMRPYCSLANSVLRAEWQKAASHSFQFIRVCCNRK
jgi:hypothetical protein